MFHKAAEAKKIDQNVLGAVLELLLLTYLCLVNCQDEGTKQALKAVSESTQQFTIALNQELSSDLSTNMITSPLSLEIILGLTSQGAKGTTKEQIQTALHLPEDDSATRTGFQQLLAPMKSNSYMTLNIADAMFVQQDLPLQPSFINVARSSFEAGAESVDFASHLDDAINTINSWVEEKTNNKIQDLVNEDVIHSNTELVLVNALYFKGLWNTSFNSTLTKERSFYPGDTNCFAVTEMMATVDKFGYFESDELNAKILEIKYKGEEMRLIIVLPNKVSGLIELIPTLRNIQQIPIQLPQKKIELYLPKFKIEQKIQYDEILKNLGMTDIFQSNADFSGITTADSLYVGHVIQKSYFEINEEGTEAASASEIDFEKTALNTVFNANHPFLYFVQHIPTESILFLGRYAGPETST